MGAGSAVGVLEGAHEPPGRVVDPDAHVPGFLERVGYGRVAVERVWIVLPQGRRGWRMFRVRRVRLDGEEIRALSRTGVQGRVEGDDPHQAGIRCGCLRRHVPGVGGVVRFARSEDDPLAAAVARPGYRHRVHADVVRGDPPDFDLVPGGERLSPRWKDPGDHGVLGVGAARARARFVGISSGVTGGVHGAYLVVAATGDGMIEERVLHDRHGAEKVRGVGGEFRRRVAEDGEVLAGVRGCRFPGHSY